MNAVNRFPSLPDDVELHVPMLAGKLVAEVRQMFTPEDWGELRQSHLRLLATVPRDGISVTDLAAALGMTKQACGQFVTALEGSGHVATRTDGADRRVRRVVRTPLGDQIVRATNARIRRIERQWARRVGAQRYATFRAVLEELASDSG